MFMCVKDREKEENYPPPVASAVGVGNPTVHITSRVPLHFWRRDRFAGLAPPAVTVVPAGSGWPVESHVLAIGGVHSHPGYRQPVVDSFGQPDIANRPTAALAILASTATSTGTATPATCA